MTTRVIELGPLELFAWRRRGEIGVGFELVGWYADVSLYRSRSSSFVRVALSLQSPGVHDDG